MTPEQHVERLRKMCDQKNWPVKKGDYFIHEGELWEFVSDDPLEECIRRALFKGALQ